MNGRRGFMTGRCACGDDTCLHYQCGYPLCRPCDEHHRAPECAIDQHGRPLAPCGHPWDAHHGPGPVPCEP